MDTQTVFHADGNPRGEISARLSVFFIFSYPSFPTEGNAITRSYPAYDVCPSAKRKTKKRRRM